MGVHQIDYIFLDTRARIEAGRQYRFGEPSGILLAIAAAARLIAWSAARIERWARRPAANNYVPRIPAR